jgi:hypothetical protein
MIAEQVTAGLDRASKKLAAIGVEIEAKFGSQVSEATSDERARDDAQPSGDIRKIDRLQLATARPLQ